MVIYPCMKEESDFMLSLFAREKRDGFHRMILNLKQLNKNAEHEHFKIDSLRSVLIILRPNC